MFLIIRKNFSLKILLSIVTLFLIISCKNKPLFLNVPYVTTPDFVVDRMMQMAHVGHGDYVIDLGSGDGRIVIAAAQLGAYGHGVDIDPERIEESRQNAIQTGVDDKAMFLQENIFRTDISDATVVTMFLLSSINTQLRPRLFDMLEPGTQVVSHKFNMGEWEPDNYAPVMGPDGTIYEVFLWIMPARIEGTWQYEVNNLSFSMTAGQQFQEADLTIMADSDTLSTLTSTLHGKQVIFSTTLNEHHYQYWGEVSGDTLKGYVQVHGDENSNLFSWTAVRAPS